MSTEMEHTNEQNLYTERYLLGGLSTEEQQAFEEHFFDCQICGEDVFAASRMLAVRGRVGKAEAEQPSNVIPMWQRWVPQAAAASIISASLGWFGAVQYLGPRAAAVQEPPALELISSQFELRTSEERGPEERSPQAVDSEKTIIDFLIPGREDAESYVVTLRNPAGKSIFSTPVERSKSAEYQHLVVRRALPRGNYLIVIEGVRKGGKRFPITDIPFEVGERLRGP